MNTPRTAFAAFALTILSGGRAWSQTPPSSVVPLPAASNPYNQGTTADGKTIVAPGTYGPFQTPTCEAGPACSAANLSSVEGPLLDIGKKQEAEARAKQTAEVQKIEDGMLKDGTYKAITRDPDGNGAVITLPNGMIAYSDYAHGFNTMPKKPEDVLSDPNAPAAMKDAAQKIVDAQNPDKLQKDAAEKKMFGGSPDGGQKKNGGFSPGITSVGSNPGGQGTTSGGDTASAGGDGTDGASDPNGGTDISGMGGMIAGGGGGSPSRGATGGKSGGATGGDTGGDVRAADREAMAEVADLNVKTTYVKLQQFLKSKPIEELQEAAAKSPDARSADGGDGKVGDESRGTKLFGR